MAGNTVLNAGVAFVSAPSRMTNVHLYLQLTVTIIRLKLVDSRCPSTMLRVRYNSFHFFFGEHQLKTSFDESCKHFLLAWTPPHILVPSIDLFLNKSPYVFLNMLIKLNIVCGSCLFHWELIWLVSLDWIEEFFGINTKTILGARPCVKLKQIKGAQKAMMSENFEHPVNTL